MHFCCTITEVTFSTLVPATLLLQILSGGSGASGSGSGSGPGTGPIVADYGLYLPGTKDFPKGPDPQATLDNWPRQNIISGENLNLAPVWNDILVSFQNIHDAQIPYDILSFNQRTSNSVPMSALRDAGYDTVPIVYDSGGFAPGWTTYLRPTVTQDSQGNFILDRSYQGQLNTHHAHTRPHDIHYY